METYKNFLLFVFKSALVVGLASAFSAAIIAGIFPPADKSFLAPVLYIGFIGLLFGGVSGILGFWIVWLFRKRPEKQFKLISFVIAIFLGLGSLSIFYNGNSTFSLSWALLIFPVLPFVISVFIFTIIAQRHIRAINICAT